MFLEAVNAAADAGAKAIKMPRRYGGVGGSSLSSRSPVKSSLAHGAEAEATKSYTM